MINAYKVAAIAVRQRFKEQDPDGLRILDSLKPEEVAVYRGAHDHVQEALKLIDIPFNMDPQPKVLMKAKIAFANCASSFAALSNKSATDFVENGGILVSSDWSLKGIVEKAFPGIIRHNGKSTGDEVIAVEPDTDSVWEDVVVLGVEPQWWLEGASYPIEILQPEKVRVEAASHELMVKHGSPTVALSFDWGKGMVYHVISHFWAKRSKAPSERHKVPYDEFLRLGLQLSDEGIADVITQSGIKTTAVNFGMLQTAATSLELLAKLCIRAKQNEPVIS